MELSNEQFEAAMNQHDAEVAALEAKIEAERGQMKYRAVYSAVTFYGHSIGLIKSLMQKSLRRREAGTMKWCVNQMLLFKRHAIPIRDHEVSLAKALETNCINRLLIMAEEELVFTEVGVYLRIRDLVDAYYKSDEDAYGMRDKSRLFEICDLLCSAKLCRIASDAANYGICSYTGRNSDENVRVEWIAKIKAKTYAESVEYIAQFDGYRFNAHGAQLNQMLMHVAHVFLNEREEKLTQRLFNRTEPVYLLWDTMIRKLEAKRDNRMLVRAMKTRLQEFFRKDRSERKFFLYNAALLYLYPRRCLNFEAKIDAEKYRLADMPEGDIEIPDYAIDMHTSEGRRLGKNTLDFAKDGSFVVDECVDYVFLEWREFYHEIKAKDAEKAEAEKKNKPNEKKRKAEKEADAEADAEEEEA